MKKIISGLLALFTGITVTIAQESSSPVPIDPDTKLITYKEVVQVKVPRPISSTGLSNGSTRPIRIPPT
jgi:hypothetical protein